MVFAICSLILPHMSVAQIGWHLNSKTIHSGMFPCFFGGFLSRFVSSMDRD